MVGENRKVFIFQVDKYEYNCSNNGEQISMIVVGTPLKSIRDYGLFLRLRIDFDGSLLWWDTPSFRLQASTLRIQIVLFSVSLN